TMQDVGTPFTANPDFLMRPAKHPTLAQHEGVTYVTRVARDAMLLDACDLEVRRFEGGWLDPSPISLGLAPANYERPQIAVNAEARVALTWHGLNLNFKQFWAAFVSADLAVEGAAWLLTSNHGAGFVSSSDVVALDDGSFAFG